MAAGYCPLYKEIEAAHTSFRQIAAAPAHVTGPLRYAGSASLKS